MTGKALTVLFLPTATCAAILAATVGSGSANADTVCGAVDANGVVTCSDGSYQYVDDRGHLLIFGPDHTLRMDLPPTQPWY